MKIVHLEDFVHPDAGYQLNILAPLQKRQGHDVTIVTGELDKMPPYLTAFFGRDHLKEKDERFIEETGVKIVRVPLLGFFSGRAIFRPDLLWKVIKEKPDVLFVHGEDTLTGILFIWMSRWLNFPLVYDCHMVEMASLNRFRNYFRAFYKRFVTPVILKRNIPIIRVVDSNYVQKCLGIPLSHTTLLSFGTDTVHFSPNSDMRRQFRLQNGLSEDAFVVLYAGKMDETKGGLFLSEAIQSKLAAINGRTIEFLIVGNTDGDYGKKVEANFSKSENKIIRLPTQRYLDLSKIYQVADLAVFPKQCSMSFFEAQSCGVPILFEENEINCQRAQFKNAFLFQPGNIQNFRSKLLELVETPQDQYENYRKSAREYILNNFDYVPIASQFTQVMKDTLVDWKKQKFGNVITQQ